MPMTDTTRLTVGELKALLAKCDYDARPVVLADDGGYFHVGGVFVPTGDEDTDDGYIAVTLFPGDAELDSRDY